MIPLFSAGPDGKLTCTRCKKTFHKERVFNAHKCVAVSDYVDLTSTKDLAIAHGESKGESWVQTKFLIVKL